MFGAVCEVDNGGDVLIVEYVIDREGIVLEVLHSFLFTYPCHMCLRVLRDALFSRATASERTLVRAIISVQVINQLN